MRPRLGRLGRSFRFAWAGVRHLFRHEPNARIHLALALLAGALAWWLGFSAVEWSILALTMGAVFLAEALNTALEALTDRVSPDYSEEARVAKDVAAGGVLLMAFFALLVGVLLYGPKLLARIP